MSLRMFSSTFRTTHPLKPIQHPPQGQALSSSARHNPSHRSPTSRPQTHRPVAVASTLKTRCPKRPLDAARCHPFNQRDAHAARSVLRARRRAGAVLARAGVRVLL